MKRRASLSTPKKHHFVPQWYLQQFSDDDGFLHIYDKDNDLWRRQKAKEVMHRNRYYSQSWAPKGIDPNILERRLANDIEPNGKLAINKLLSWENDLTPREWASLVNYISFQSIRVPKSADLAKNFLRTQLLFFYDPEITEAYIKGEIDLKIEDSFRFDYMRLAITKLYKYFLRMEWEIVSPINSQFITTDFPVTFCHPNYTPIHHVGPGLVGTMILFPLRPDRLLIMRHPELHEENPNLNQIVDIQNRNENGTRVYQERTFSEEEVIAHNTLMIEYSQRLSVSSSKEVLEQALGRELKGNR